MGGNTKCIFVLFFILIVSLGEGGFAMRTAIEDKGTSPINSGQRDWVFIRQSGKNHIIVEGKSLNVAGNLDININIEGKGQLQVGYQKKVDIRAHHCSVNNLLINEGSVVVLKGEMKVNKQLLIRDALLLLEDNDLILTEEAFSVFVDYERLIYNGTGRLVIDGQLPVFKFPLFHHSDNISIFSVSCIKKGEYKSPELKKITALILRNRLPRKPFIEVEPHPPKVI